ncbi:MAG: DUF2207 domain-containing protein, partial [Calditrichia bacterium]
MKRYFEHPKKSCKGCTPETAAISECAGRFSFLLILLTLALSFLLLGIPPVSAAKSYSIGDISVRANILEDGSLRVEESRTYHFQGSFSWADYRLPLNRIGNVQNFSITENGKEYRRSSGEEPGTFYTREDGNEFYARWYYRARNESRTFTLRYLVADAVTAYDDIAEFYYQFIGVDNAKRIGNVDISISLPRPATPDEVKIWAHGPLWGKIDFSGNYIRMSVSPLPAQQFWEARVVFPNEWAPDVRKRLAGAQLNSIMAQEAAWARRANEQREAAIEELHRRKVNEEKAWPVSLILSIFGFISLMVLYRKYGRSFPVPYNQKFDSALPEEKIPAVVSALYYNKQVNGNALASTLFDLARRGFLSIEQRMPAEKKWWRSDAPHFIMKINQK